MPVKIDMEMPKSCDFCRFAYFTSYACVCYAAEGAVFCKYIDKRPEGCPLLEVK